MPQRSEEGGTDMRLLKPCTNLLVLFCSLPVAAPAFAQNYPTRAVRYIVPDSAGGLADALARIVAGGLTDVFGQQVIVDNRTGAAGNISATIAAKAAPDGYTMYEMSQTLTVNATLYRSLSYDLLRDFAPVTRLGWSPSMVIVHPSLPVESIGELVRLAKAKPGSINFASAGSGTPTHLGPELFKITADVNMTHVPYRGGGEAITAVMSGETPLYFAPLSAGLAPVRSGRLRALAVTSAKRLELLPALPTIAESGYPGYESGFWFGLVVPAKTPKGTISAIHQATVAALKRPEVEKRMQDIQFTPLGDRPEEFAAFIKLEIDKWGRIIRATGLTVD
jgi:tripartite-type tricarboxylate transporter receptor subunit TctC